MRTSLIRRVGFGLAWSAAVGCPKPSLPANVDVVAPPASTVEWTEVVSIDKFAELRLRVRQQWSAPVDEDGQRVFTVAEFEDHGEGERLRERYQLFYGPEGFGYLSTEDETGAREPWVPVELVLPPEPAIGQTWSNTHRKGARTIERSCEIMASGLCRGGIVSVCDAKDQDSRTIMREHFCPGAGFSGYEALHLANGHATRRWSEQLVRDGQLVSP